MDQEEPSHQRAQDQRRARLSGTRIRPDRMKMRNIDRAGFAGSHSPRTTVPSGGGARGGAPAPGNADALGTARILPVNGGGDAAGGP